MKTNILIRNHTIIKCFSFSEKRIFNFTTMFCSTILFFNTSTFTNFFARIYPANYFLAEIWKHGTDFSISAQVFFLLLLILLKRYINADLKICWFIHVVTTFSFWQEWKQQIFCFAGLLIYITKRRHGI